MECTCSINFISSYFFNFLGIKILFFFNFIFDLINDLIKAVLSE